MNNTTVKLSILPLTLICCFHGRADDNVSETKYQFDSAMVWGGGGDLTSFEYENKLPPGIQKIFVKTNYDFQKISLEVNFVAIEDHVKACFTKEQLQIIGLNIKSLPVDKQNKIEKSCQFLSDLVSQSNEDYDFSSGILTVTIPQANYVSYIKRDVDLSASDSGVYGLSSNYNIYYNTINPFNNSYYSRDTYSAYLNNSIHTNFGLLIKNSSTYNKNSGYSSQRTYAEYDVLPFKSRIQAGEIFTNSDYFDSVTMKGITLSSNRSMWSYSDKRSIPVISGTANAEALVKVYQGKNLIHQEKVTPGPFKIDNYTPYGYSGDLEVYVEEVTGRVTKFIVPYNLSIDLIKKGKFIYTVGAGEFDSGGYNDSMTPMVYMAGITYGIADSVNLSTGLLFTERYLSNSIGTAFSSPFGAFKADINHAYARPYISDNGRNYDGYSSRVSYSKAIDATNTGITLSMLKYYTKDFWTLNDSVQKYSSSVDRPKYQLGLYVNQPVFDYGYINISATNNTYWSKYQRDQVYTNISWSSNYKSVSYSLNYGFDRSQSQLGLSFTVPFGNNNRTFLRGDYINNGKYGDNKFLSTDTTFEKYPNFQLGTSISQNASSRPGYALRGGYTGQYGRISMDYYDQKDYKSASLSGNGSLVLYSDGLIFSQSTGNTIGIIDVPGAGGSTINNSLNNKLNNNGKGTVSLYPYNLNRLGISPENSSLSLDISSTEEQVLPRYGSLIPVMFDSKVNSGSKILILADNLMSKFNFGEQISDHDGNILGYISQGKRVLISGDNKSNIINIKKADGSLCTIEIQHTELTEFGLPVWNATKCSQH